MSPDEVRRLTATEYRAFCEYMREYHKAKSGGFGG